MEVAVAYAPYVEGEGSGSGGVVAANTSSANVSAAANVTTLWTKAETLTVSLTRGSGDATSGGSASGELHLFRLRAKVATQTYRETTCINGD